MGSSAMGQDSGGAHAPGGHGHASPRERAAGSAVRWGVPAWGWRGAGTADKCCALEHGASVRRTELAACVAFSKGQRTSAMQMLASGKQQEALSPRQECGARRRQGPSGPSSLAAGRRVGTTRGTQERQGKGADVEGSPSCPALAERAPRHARGPHSAGLGNHGQQRSQGGSAGTQPLGSEYTPGGRSSDGDHRKARGPDSQADLGGCGRDPGGSASCPPSSRRGCCGFMQCPSTGFAAGKQSERCMSCAASGEGNCLPPPRPDFCKRALLRSCRP